jgi:GGDEF domain-containing protein
LIDLEQFHVVNESAGRRKGRRVLWQIGRELSQTAGDAEVARGSLYRFAVLAELPPWPPTRFSPDFSCSHQPQERPQAQAMIQTGPVIR